METFRFDIHVWEEVAITRHQYVVSVYICVAFIHIPLIDDRVTRHSEFEKEAMQVCELKSFSIFSG